VQIIDHAMNPGLEDAHPAIDHQNQPQLFDSTQSRKDAKAQGLAERGTRRAVLPNWRP